MYISIFWVDFPSTTLASRDIGDNWFNWPIIQLMNGVQKFSYSLIHVPHSQVPYAVDILRLTFFVLT